MRDLVAELGRVIDTAILSVPAPQASRRPSTKAIYGALKKNVRPVVEKHFGGPVFCRYSGCPEGPAKSYSKTPSRVFKVLEYLWDFSLSRYAIPQAIHDPQATPIKAGKFELLFVAESELGTKNETCRDLLKLLEVRACVRCLIYRQPKRASESQQFEARMVRVMHSHAQFLPVQGIWLFVGLTCASQKMGCSVSTFSRKENALVRVEVT
jgi:hypothetical protein